MNDKNAPGVTTIPFDLSRFKRAEELIPGDSIIVTAAGLPDETVTVTKVTGNLYGVWIHYTRTADSVVRKFKAEPDWGFELQ